MSTIQPLRSRGNNWCAKNKMSLGHPFCLLLFLLVFIFCFFCHIFLFFPLFFIRHHKMVSRTCFVYVSLDLMFNTQKLFLFRALILMGTKPKKQKWNFFLGKSVTLVFVVCDLRTNWPTFVRGKKRDVSKCVHYFGFWQKYYHFISRKAHIFG